MFKRNAKASILKSKRTYITGAYRGKRDYYKDYKDLLVKRLERTGSDCCFNQEINSKISKRIHLLRQNSAKLTMLCTVIKQF